jgi:hypothetical protein
MNELGGSNYPLHQLVRGPCDKGYMEELQVVTFVGRLASPVSSVERR